MLQNVMKAYYEKFNNETIINKHLMEIFTDSHFHVSDYLIFIYVVLFIMWVANFVRNLFYAMQSFYKRDSLLMALHKATFNNDTLTALKLCQTDPEAINQIVDADGLSPFLRACYHGNTQLVKYMLQLGADTKSKTKRGENALFLAVYNRIKKRSCRDASCIHALYHAGVDINEVNANNLNVLQLAALFGHTSLTRWLLSKNANFNVVPSPYYLARSAGHTETMNLLRELHILSE